MKSRIVIISIMIMAVIASAVFGLEATIHFLERSDTDIKTQIQEYAKASDVEKLLIQNQIDYNPDKLVTSRAISFKGGSHAFLHLTPLIIPEVELVLALL